MAVVGAAVAGGEVAGYNGRITSFVALSCVYAAMGGVIFGYDIGISGGVTSMEPFLKKFFPEVHEKMKEDSNTGNYCKFDSQLLTAFTASLYIAGLVASFFAASVTTAFGRRPSMLFGGAAFLAGAVLGGAAVDIYMLILGRVLLGVGVGFADQSVPLYLSEMAPPRLRGAFNNGFQFSIGVGALAANLINYGTEKISGGWGWRLSLALAAVPAIFLVVGSLFLPDTPNSMLQRLHNNNHNNADIEKVRHLLQKIRGTPDVTSELDDLIKASSSSSSSNKIFTFNLLWRPEHRPPLAMAVAIPFFQQVTGINAIAFYAPVLFRTMGLGESASLMSAVATGVVGAGSTLLSMFLVDRLGRRTLFLVGGIQMFVSQMAVGAIMGLELKEGGGMSREYSVLVLLMICLYVAGFGVSWGPLGWLVPSEVFPLEVRAAGQSVTVAVGFFWTFLVAQGLLAMLCKMEYGIFFFFGGWLVVMTVFVFVFLPETKGVPIEKMDAVWRSHWFWKKVVAGAAAAKNGESLN